MTLATKLENIQSRLAEIYPQITRLEEQVEGDGANDHEDYISFMQEDGAFMYDPREVEDAKKNFKKKKKELADLRKERKKLEAEEVELLKELPDRRPLRLRQLTEEITRRAYTVAKYQTEALQTAGTFGRSCPEELAQNARFAAVVEELKKQRRKLIDHYAKQGLQYD